ncbi:MAG: hypothetical protein HQ570_01205 [Candidatus Omnitrophica bacterium]|nr:hypothetical protein [Candidatus Omnitrophota bacterium]
MRYLKSLIIIFCLLLLVFPAGPGYCFFRDDMDHEKIIRETEKKRRESKDRLRENQAKKEIEQKEKIKIQELISKETKQAEKAPVRSKPKIETIGFLILCLGLGGYLLYRRKRQNN